MGTRRAAAAGALLLALTVPAGAAGEEPLKAQVAQLAVLAELAPLACPDIRADDAAVTAFMARAGIGQRDLSTRYRAAAVGVVATLKQSVERDRDAACDTILQRLGADGLGLVREGDADDPP